MGNTICKYCRLQKPNYLSELTDKVNKEWQTRDRVRLIASSILVVIASYFALSAFGYCLQASILVTTFKVSTTLLLGVLASFLFDESENSFRSPEIPFLGHQNNGENICFLNGLLSCLWGLDEENSFRDFLSNPGEGLKPLGQYFKQYLADLDVEKGHKYCTRRSNSLRTLFFPNSNRNSQEDPCEVLDMLNGHLPDHLKTTVTTVRRFVVPEGTPNPLVANENNPEIGAMRLRNGNFEQIVTNGAAPNQAEEVTRLYVHELSFNQEKELDFTNVVDYGFYGEYPIQDIDHSIELERPNADGGQTRYRAFQEIRVNRLPEVWPIRVNRYSKDGGKIGGSRLINVLEELTFKGAWGPGEDGQYQLKAFQCHSGASSNSGHYYSFVKNKGNWFKINDEVVTKVSQEEVNAYLESKSYLLFYTRQKPDEVQAE